MGKKKPFVEKKKCATFRLTCTYSYLSSSSHGFRSLAGELGCRVFIRVAKGSTHIPGFTEDDYIVEDADEFCSNSLPISYQGQGPLPDHLRREMIDRGFPDDGYNYLRHLRHIGGGSAFVPSTEPMFIPTDIKAYDASKLRIQSCSDQKESNINAWHAVSSSTILIGRGQEAIDPEVVAHLEKSDGSEFDSDVEDLEEDFVIHANKPEEEED